jgi:hypothetical protein
MRNQYLVKTACPSSSGTLRPEHCAGVSVKHIERNQESIKMATKIEQFSYADKVAALTHQYLELGLPLNSALRAAEADLWEPENLGLVKQYSQRHQQVEINAA